MRNYTGNDFIISIAYRELKLGLFTEQEPDKYRVMNKWTGEDIGTFNSYEEAREAVHNACR